MMCYLEVSHRSAFQNVYDYVVDILSFKFLIPDKTYEICERDTIVSVTNILKVNE